MTCAEIQQALVGYGTNCLWSPRRVLAARNTTGVVGWEADLILMHGSGWTWEVEVKVSATDFRREFRAATKIEKHRVLQAGHHAARYDGSQRQNLVRKFWFAMPLEIYCRVSDEVPSYAGVILLDTEVCDRLGRLRPWIAKKAKDLPARKVEAADRELLRTSVYYRYWDIKTEATA